LRAEIDGGVAAGVGRGDQGAARRIGRIELGDGSQFTTKTTAQRAGITKRPLSTSNVASRARASAA